MTSILTATPDVFMARLGITEGTSRSTLHAANILYRTWREILSQEGRGATYNVEFRTFHRADGSMYVAPVGPKDLPHQASAPGDPPARESGDLRRSILIHPVSKSVVRVLSTDPAAVWMEFGVGVATPLVRGAGFRLGPPGTPSRETPAGGGEVRRAVTILPRPHLRPAVRKALPEIRTQSLGIMRAAFRGPRTRTDLIRAARTGIIGFSRMVGDLGALGVPIPAGMNRLRAQLLRTGRGLGDAQALAEGRIGDRIKTRIVGRQTNRLVGEMVPAATGTFGNRVQQKVKGGFVAGILSRI